MKTIQTDVAIMGSGVAGMGAAYKLAAAGGVKVAVFEKYPAQGGAVSNCPMCFCSTPDTPEAQKAAYEVLARFSNYTANMALISKVVKYSSEFPRIFLEELKIKAPYVVNRPPEEYGKQRGYTMGHANGLDVGDVYFLEGRGQGHALALALLRLRMDLEKKGVEFYFNTPIKKILRDESGKVTGAIATDREGTEEIKIECKALIVASGGITGNIPMMKELGVIKRIFNEKKVREMKKENIQVFGRYDFAQANKIAMPLVICLRSFALIVVPVILAAAGADVALGFRNVFIVLTVISLISTILSFLLKDKTIGRTSVDEPG